MWSFRTIAFLAVLGLLGACGFRPLYGDRTAAGGAPSELASIKIAAIPDRIGQQMHNHLLTALNPRGQPRRPRYILHTRINESISSLAVRKSAFATRANLAVTAHYNLAPSAGGQSLFSAKSSITVSYNILDSEFATLMAEKDARARAIREISEDIRIRLSVFLASRQGQEK